MERGTDNAQSFKGVHRNVRVTNPIHPLFGLILKEVRVFSRCGEREVWYKDEKGLTIKLPMWATDLSPAQTHQKSSFFTIPKLILLTRKISDLCSNDQNSMELKENGGCHGFRRQDSSGELFAKDGSNEDEEIGAD